MRGVCLRGDSGSGIREGVTSRSVWYGLVAADFEGLDLIPLSFSSDFRYQVLFDFCHAGGAHGPSDSASDSSASCALHRDEDCILELEL